MLASLFSLWFFFFFLRETIEVFVVLEGINMCVYVKRKRLNFSRWWLQFHCYTWIDPTFGFERLSGIVFMV